MAPQLKTTQRPHKHCACDHGRLLTLTLPRNVVVTTEFNENVVVTTEFNDTRNHLVERGGGFVNYTTADGENLICDADGLPCLS